MRHTRAIEAFFATAIGERVAPHTELFRIRIVVKEQARDPSIETNELDMTSTVTWPRGLQIISVDRQRDVNRFYCEVAAHVLGAACMIKEANAFIEELHADAAVQ